MVDDVLRIAVDDAGPGVPGTTATGSSSGSPEGSTERSGVGLGLAIVKRHVALHGGGVGLTSAEGGGARFVVRLPLAGVRHGQGHSRGVAAGNPQVPVGASTYVCCA